MGFTVHEARWCQGNEQDSVTVTGSRGDEYHLSYGSHNPGEYQYNWACTCKGYQHRGRCRHVDQAEQARCDYGWGASAGSPLPDDVWVGKDKRCPNCNRPSVVMRYAA